MIKNIISNLFHKFNKKSLGEVTISLIVGVIVFLALAFGIIELGTMAYKDMVINNKLESVVKSAESKSILFTDNTAKELLDYKDNNISCTSENELKCSDDSDKRCKFWKTLYNVARQEDLGGLYDEKSPKYNYASKGEDNGKCMARVAVKLPGFKIAYHNGSSNINFDLDDTGNQKIIDQLKSTGTINAEAEVIKEKGLFSFYTKDKFVRKMYHIGKPRVFTTDSGIVTKTPCPTKRICGKLCCDEVNTTGINCGSINEECCDNEKICGDLGNKFCCKSGEACEKTGIGEGRICCPIGHKGCGSRCCDEGETCINPQESLCSFVTPTDTPVPPTNTNTPVPPTNTNTPVPPTNTNTPVPPTNTNTPVAPTNTPTELTCDIDKQCDTTCCGVDETCVNKVCVIITSTPTDTPITPTDTPTDTPVPPTDTNTPIPPTNTNTPEPPTNTPTNTPVVPTATNTPFGGGCRCPDGYVCMDDPEGDSNPSGNNNRCCNDEEGNPGEGCCENRNYHDPQDGVNSPICCEDNQVPHYANYPDGRVVFTCESGCPEGFKTYPEVNNIFVCCPDEAPVFHGYSQFSNIPVCCAQGANFCGGTSCCPVTGSVHVTGGVYGQGGTDFQFDSDARYCAPIKGSMIALQATGGGLAVKEAQTCCRGENDVFCGGTCCPSERCVAPVANEGERMTLRYDELEDRSRVADWSYVIGLFNHDAFVRGHKCCLTPNEIFTSGYTDNGDAIQDCCVTEDENGEVINEVITFTDENGRDVSVCCGSENVHELDDGSLACCNGTWGEFEIVEGGQTSSASSKNTTNSSYSYTTNSDNSRYSDTYSDDGISDISVRKIYKCCEVGAPYLDENNEPQCCDGTTFVNAQTGKLDCCPTNEKKPNGRQKWDLGYSDDGNSAVCCERNASGKINAGIGADGKLTCCGSDDKVFTDFYGKKHCCPSDQYYTNQGVAGCCDGKVIDIVGKQNCCEEGQNGYLDSNGNAQCCDGDVYPTDNPLVSPSMCCNGKFYRDLESEVQCCEASRSLVTIESLGMKTCCDNDTDKAYVDTQTSSVVCCDGDIYYDENASPQCCDGGRKVCGNSCCDKGQTCDEETNTCKTEEPCNCNGLCVQQNTGKYVCCSKEHNGHQYANATEQEKPGYCTYGCSKDEEGCDEGVSLMYVPSQELDSCNECPTNVETDCKPGYHDWITESCCGNLILQQSPSPGVFSQKVCVRPEGERTHSPCTALDENNNKFTGTTWYEAERLVENSWVVIGCKPIVADDGDMCCR